ncbi:hypothetical protein B9G69_005070 [Bdellovibrio sp. SKB1291214]|uniref:hypothetical protein n=1 Tax=Bdellovibrio sp. SKB1291214 TaxID=1732569 RepID=UPI00223EAECC|nr:hypothetical protein [Bdellovibrio sp. SKB1291214]UYL09946.1 hypothetical protein B9G69_005070 [Bdellovibrio sp. SKB1291214]
MKTLTRLTALAFAVGFYVGCSPVNFGVSSADCNASTNCVVSNNKKAYSYSVTAGAGKVDILIVNDNSASMSFEQKRLAPRFANFIQNLDASKVDYRIAITTTDVSGGKFPQGGQLISYGDGSKYITPSNSNRLALFNAAIQRTETQACENFIANYLRNNGASSINTSGYSSGYAANCPSGDERGIYSANLIVQNNPSSFIRTDAHLSIIFLSDEDERSSSAVWSNGYPLSNLDQPSTLPKTVKSVLGDAKYNSLSIHAIVVRDSSCLAQQNSQVLGDNPNQDTRGLVSGAIGTAYLAFTTTSPAWGVSADICSSDYTGQLGTIQTSIQAKIKDILLNCSNPTDVVVSVSGTNVAHSINGNVLTFSQTLSPGTTVNLSYKCGI